MVTLSVLFLFEKIFDFTKKLDFGRTCGLFFCFIRLLVVSRLVECLDDKEEDDILLNGIKYTEKEGNYWVYVNVQTGVIEEISYSAAIGGNG